MSNVDSSTRVPHMLKRGGNWQLWSRKMNSYLFLRQRLNKWLEKTPDTSNADEVENDEECRHYLMMFIDGSLSHIVAGASTSFQAWKGLEKELEEGLALKRSTLMTQISSLGMRDSHDHKLSDYIIEGQELLIEAKQLNMTSAADTLCTHFVQGLNDELYMLAGSDLLRTVEEHRGKVMARDMDMGEIEIMFQDIVSRLRTRASMLVGRRRKQSTHESSNAAMMGMLHNRQPPPRPAARMPLPYPPAAGFRDYRDDSRAWTPPKVCHYCGVEGHIKRFCPKLYGNHQAPVPPAMHSDPYRPQLPPFHAPPMPPNQHNDKGNEKGRCFSMTTHKKRAFMSKIKANSKRLAGKTYEMIYDSGASHHIATRKEMLFAIRPSDIYSITVGGGQEHRVLAMGSMRVNTVNGPFTLTDVLLVPEVVTNVCSQTQVSDKGGTTWEQGGFLMVYKASLQPIFTGNKRDDGLIWVNGEIEIQDLSTQRKSKVQEGHMLGMISMNTFHARLGHPNMQVTKKIAKGELADGVQNIEPIKHGDDQSCDACAKAKQHRASFPPSTSTTSRPLEIVHSDVTCYSNASLGGARFAVSMLDDFSGFAEVIPITSKRDVPNIVKEVIRRWQRQTDLKLKVFRTDQGTEYFKLREFFKREGVIHQTSSAYTPEQNGCAERLNRTVKERARAMMLHKKLPEKFWAEAIRTAAFTRNLIPSGQKEQSPYEMMWDKRPSVENLRIFGSPVQVHVPKEKRNAWQPNSIDGIFVGYPATVKGWRVLVWSDGSLRVLETIHVTFEEDKLPQLPSDFQEAIEGDFMMEDEGDIENIENIPALGQQQTPPDNGADSGAMAASGLESLQSSSNHSENGDSDVPSMHMEPSDWSLRDEEDHATCEESENGHSDAAEEQNIESNEGRPKRNRQPSTRLKDSVLHFIHGEDQDDPEAGTFDEPLSIRQALSRPDGYRWEQAMHEELRALCEKGVYEEVPLPKGKRIIPSRMVLKIKRDQYGNVEKYKARLVAKGFMQKEGVDYDEIFAPTAQPATFRTLMSIAATEDLSIHQIDVATAFLNGPLTEEVYIKPPEAICGNKVWRLRKALYGLKQAARAWNDELQRRLTEIGFTACESDPCLYLRGSQEDRVMALFHVDDAVIIGNEKAVKMAKIDIGGVFTIKDMGESKFFLGIEVSRCGAGIMLTQEKYVEDLLVKFEMSAGPPKATPMSPGCKLVKEGVPLPEDNRFRELMGSLLYLSVNTRPDIAQAVGSLSRYMSCPTTAHWNAAKHLLRYLRGSRDMGIVYPKEQGCATSPDDTPKTRMRVYCDANFAGDLDTRKSTTGVIIKLGQNAPVIWSSKLQNLVTTSTTEAEYVAACSAVKEGLWLRKLLAEIEGRVSTLEVYCDNQAAIHLVKNRTAGVSGRSRHIDTQCHFLRERHLQGDFSIHSLCSGKQLADVFTKSLPKIQFGYLFD